MLVNNKGLHSKYHGALALPHIPHTDSAELYKGECPIIDPEADKGLF